MNRALKRLLCILPILICGTAHMTYPVEDTGQEECYNATVAITCPSAGEAFSGQDAQYDGNLPLFTVSSDGLTVYDHVTGLTWIKTPDTDGDDDLDSDDKLSWSEFQSYPNTLNAQSYGGYNDWRRPSIKELYSIIDFSGIDPSGYQGGTEGLIPFIDTDYFDFAFGDENAGERIIDAQYWSSTEYVGTVFGGENAVFGVNFADGRIKGYPRDSGPGGTMTQFVRLCRGNTDYGINDFEDNGDGTVTDHATGLMWQKSDSGSGMFWEDTLAYAETLDHAGYDDWRLPNAKELESIVDYSRSPSTTGSPAIDPVFTVTSITDEGGSINYPFFWSGTTHANYTATPGTYAAYVAFGEALGWMEMPPGSGNYQLMDVHGAGAQRSDPKEGNPDEWPYGHGPQGDVIRIFNFVRAVRWVSDPPTPAPTATPDNTPAVPTATPTFSDQGVRLEMPASYFSPGDSCRLTAHLDNTVDPMTNVPLAVILDVYSQYWFWPSWDTDFEYGLTDVPSGTTTMDIIPGFTWPDTGTDAANGIIFWAAMLTPDLMGVLGDTTGIGRWEFGFGP